MLQNKDRELIQNLLSNASEKQISKLWSESIPDFQRKYYISFGFFRVNWEDDDKKSYCTVIDRMINVRIDYILPNPEVEEEFYKHCHFGKITRDLAESIVAKTEGRFRITKYGEIYDNRGCQRGTVMSRRESLGFKEGFITLLKGDQSLYEEWLRADAMCRYHGHFKWFIPSQCDIPKDLPKGLEPVTITAEEVFQGGSDELLSWDVIDARIAELLYGDSPSAHYGTIGTRYDLELTILNITTTAGAYGNKYFYLFVDADGNEFTWSTSTSKDLSPHSTYTCRGTVKAHNVYKGKKQTELTRVMGFKPVES